MQAGICVLVKSWSVGEVLKRGDAEIAEEILGQELYVLRASAFLSLSNQIMTPP